MTALHVKYRPKSFEDLVGQKHILGSLKKVVKDQRAKTFLFTGPSGCGKTTLARILANQFAKGAGTQANIIEIDAASHSGAEAMRDVVAKAAYRAIGESPVKAFIVDEAHALSSAAWKVLLKPTEEPPEHVYWMFCTTEAGKIPPTIVTRSISYNLRSVSEDDLFKLLVQVADGENLDTPDEILEAVAEGALGSPRQALVFLEACIYAETAGQAREIMRNGGQSKEIIDLCRFLVSGKQGWMQITKLLKAINEANPESVRIVVANYLSAVLMNAKSDKEAARLMGILECFITPYAQSDKMAPLLHSIGLAIGLDRR